jgi:hypothetical protein
MDADDALRNQHNLLTAELRTAEAATPGNPLVNTTDQWVNTTLRRAIRQAAEADAEYIAIPHGDTVLSYNPGDEGGMRGFYGSRNSEGIVPKNLRKIIEKMDKDAPRPVKVAKLETSHGLQGWQNDTGGTTGPENGADPNQTGFTLFPLTDRVKQAVLDDGQPLFAFGGINAATADKEALARAEKMETAGASREDIWTDTGWFRGVDGRWRFEIDDSKSDFDLKGAMDDGWQQNQTWPLDHLLSHKSMYAAYPDISAKGISYRDFPEGYDDAAAAVSRKGDVITLNSRYRDFKNEKTMRSFALHETQHLAQREEGFAKGGGHRDFTPDELAAERARLQNIQASKPNVSDWASFDASPAVSEMSDKDIAGSLYRRLAGEVEARAVQKRMDMTPDHRRARPPWLDYDVPEREQIVRTGASGPQYAFGTVTSPNADINAYTTAVIMSKRGASKEDIWRATGWFKDASGKWRFETDEPSEIRTVADAKAHAERQGMSKDQRRENPPWMTQDRAVASRAKGGRVEVPRLDTDTIDQALAIIRRAKMH